MRTYPFNRHTPSVIRRTAIALLALLPLFASYSPQAARNLDINLSAFNGASALQVRSGTRLGDTLSPAEAFDGLNRRAEGMLEVAWDSQTGIPSFLTGRTSAVRLPYTPTAAERGNPLAIARGFLDANRPLFQLQSVAAD